MQSPELILCDDEVRLRTATNQVLTLTSNDLYSLKIEGSGWLTEVESLRAAPALSAVSFSRYPLEPKIQLQMDAIGALYCVPIGIHQGRVYEISALLDRASDHIVIDTMWMPILEQTLGDIRALLEHLRIACPGNVTLKQYIALTTDPNNKAFVRNTISNIATSPLQTQAGIGEPLPGSLSLPLYPYQETGFRWLANISNEGLGCLLGDEMGLGKTAQIIALLARERDAGARSPSLIVAPATILENWKRELARFAPSLTVLLHKGRERSGLPSELKKSDVVVASYETMVRDLPLLKLVPWNLVILDEAQAIKNPEALRTQAVKTLPRRVGIAVTGTPMENRLSDIWSIMDFALPTYLGSLDDFQTTFEGSLHEALALEPRVTPLLLRRKVQDVARDLPPRIDIPQLLELSDSGARRYEDLRSAIQREYGDAANLVALSKLRMYCSHPLLLADNAGDPLEESPKYERLVQILEEIVDNGEKVLIFTAYHKMTDIMVSDLGHRMSARLDFIDGRVPAAERQTKIDNFTLHDGAAALVLNPRTAGTGLNITAANHVVHYTLEWNPAIEDQASARAHRRGQTKPVRVYRLYYANTVEEVINDRILLKRSLAEAAVVGTEGAELEKDQILKALRASPLGKHKQS